MNMELWHLGNDVNKLRERMEKFRPIFNQEFHEMLCSMVALIDHIRIATYQYESRTIKENIVNPDNKSLDRNGRKFYLKFDWEKDWKEVTKSQYLSAEFKAGFYSKIDGEPATSSFGDSTINGRHE